MTAVTASTSHGCTFNSAPYQGWIGINGQIITPSAAPAGGFYGGADFAAGWIGMAHFAANGGSDAYIEIGWYTGSPDSCPTITDGTYALYLGYLRLGGTFQCTRISFLSYGSAVTYRIQSTSGGCWQAYYNYSTPAAAPVCGLPSAMAAMVDNVLGNSDGIYMVTPTSEFGSSSPGTNPALRLRNGTGNYEPWDSSLTAGATATQDEQTGDIPYTFYVPYSNYYHVLTFGS